MTTLAELRSLILNKSGGDFTESEITSQINSSVRFYQNRRFWFNQGFATTTLTPGDPEVPGVPSDLLYEIRDSGLVINYTQSRFPLVKISPSQYDWLNNESEGLPDYYTYEDGKFLVYFYPDIDYTLEFYYVVQPATLVNDGDRNIFLTNAERMIEYKTLADLYHTYRKDGRNPGLADKYDALATREYFEVQKRTNALNATGTIETDPIVDNNLVGESYYYTL